MFVHVNRKAPGGQFGILYQRQKLRQHYEKLLRVTLYFDQVRYGEGHWNKYGFSIDLWPGC